MKKFTLISLIGYLLCFLAGGPMLIDVTPWWHAYLAVIVAQIGTALVLFRE